MNMNKTEVMKKVAAENSFPVVDLQMSGAVGEGDFNGLPEFTKTVPLGDLGKDRNGARWTLWYVPSTKEFAFSKDGVIENKTYKEHYLMDKVYEEKIDCLAEEMSWMTKRYN